MLPKDFPTAAMPSAPIERGKPSPNLIAHVLTAKCCDHLPLYRQSEIYASIAEEALRRIGELYNIEKTIRGSPPERRLTVRRALTRPRFDGLRKWLDDTLLELPRKSGTAEVIR